MISNSLRKKIGIVGGIGPYAGVDLVQKIFDQTIADSDQKHFPVVLISRPDEIVDRTDFILGKTEINPAYAIVNILQDLEKIGIDIVGIPCNTIFASPIMNVILNEMKRMDSKVTLIHMIREVAEFLKKYHPRLKRIGVLASTGTYKQGVYEDVLAETGFETVEIDEQVQDNLINDAIYNPEYGIKANSNPISEKAKKQLKDSIKWLQDKGAEVIVLGCTEISLAITERIIDGTLVIDSNLVLARALIREADNTKLKPLELF